MVVALLRKFMFLEESRSVARARFFFFFRFRRDFWIRGKYQALSAGSLIALHHHFLDAHSQTHGLRTMDPISISGFVASILPLAYQVAAGILGFATEAHDNSETLNAFASEIQSLTRILEAATSTINDANFPAQPQGGPSTAVYRALHGAVDDIRLYLERLRLRVQRIQGDSANTNVYRNAIRTFAARINRTGINDLRSLLQTHQLSLNTALVMVHLYHTTHTAGHQQVDLRPDIYRLTSIVQRLTTAVDRERLSDDLTNHRIRDLQDVALQVVEDASQATTSTAGSETGEPVDPRDRRRIDEWLNRNVSEGSHDTDLVGRDSNKASSSHSQNPSTQLQKSTLHRSSLQLQRYTLHRSSLGLGLGLLIPRQTQPISSDSNREAIPSTGTTRRFQRSNDALHRTYQPPTKQRYAYSFISALAAAVCIWAIVCFIFDFKPCLTLPTLFMALITAVWCGIRFIRYKILFGLLGSILD